MTENEFLDALDQWEKANKDKTPEWFRKDKVGAKINSLAQKYRRSSKTEEVLLEIREVNNKVDSLIVLTPDERRDMAAEIGELYVKSWRDTSCLILARNKAESFCARFS